MKRINIVFFLIAIFFSLVTTTYAQWLETTITVGSNPYALVWNSQNNKIYCANQVSNNVTVIDGQTNSVITTIPVGIIPYALVWNSQNNKIYCVNNESNNVTVIDGQTNSVIRTIPVRSHPDALVWNSQNNKVYCANEWNATVTVIDCQADSLIRTIAVGIDPCELVWNAINNKVYCANLSSNNVMVIDCQADSLIRTIAVGYDPWALCWNSIQNRVYVVNVNSNNVSVIRDSIVSGIEEDNHRLFIADRNLLTVFPNPARSYFAIRLPQFADRSEIKIFDVSGKQVVDCFADARNDNSVRVSLDGVKNGIYFVKVNNEMVKEKLIVTR
jgi:YVTN family beta-propeller protein